MHIRVTKDDDVEITVEIVEQIANMTYDLSACDPLPADIHLHVKARVIIWENRPYGGRCELGRVAGNTRLVMRDTPTERN